MFKKGPIPPLVHGLLDYVFGALLIASPFLFSFDDGAAKAVGIAGGVIVLVIAACTDWTAGLIKSIPPSAHAIFDLIVAILLIASPFLFGFSDDDNATAVAIVAGVLDLLFAIATRFTPEPRGSRRERREAQAH
jgi:SPW repeat